MSDRIFALLTALVLAASGCVAGANVELPEGAVAGDYWMEGLRLRDQGSTDQARDVFAELVEEFPSAPEAKEAEWLAARMTFDLEEWRDAEKKFKRFHETHPLDRLGELENLLYEIGVRQYEGGKGGVLGLGILPTSERGMDTMRWITENLRQGSRADDAYMYMARKRFEGKEYEQTVDFLTFLLEDYPDSEWRYPAILLRGRAHFALNRGPEYDRQALISAKKEFNRYLREVERDESRQREYAAEIQEVKDRLAEVDDRLLEKNFLIGEWYISQERYQAAEYYLRTVADERPESEWAKKALALLEKYDSEMKEKTEEDGK